MYGGDHSISSSWRRVRWKREGSGILILVLVRLVYKPCSHPHFIWGCHFHIRCQSNVFCKIMIPFSSRVAFGLGWERSYSCLMHFENQQSDRIEVTVSNQPVMYLYMYSSKPVSFHSNIRNRKSTTIGRAIHYMMSKSQKVMVVNSYRCTWE